VVLGAGSARKEEVYEIVRAAVVRRQPISCRYHERDRLFCPHRLGRNKEGQRRVLCYQFGGQSESGLEPPGSAANWRCIALDKLSRVELLSSEWHTAPNHSRPTTCITDPDVDAEDYPEREPQQGQRGSSPIR
jgi:hypothetical protein